MLVYVILLAAATPETAFTPEAPSPYLTCPDGTSVVNLVFCPKLASSPQPQVSEVPLSDALKSYPRAAIPTTSPGGWVSTDDYPISALREEREGTSSFNLAVDANGRVLSCSITASSGSADLDAATCANMTTRANFYPATDKKGRPIASTYSNRVTWRIPDDGGTNYRFADVSNFAYPRSPIAIRYLGWPKEGDFPAAELIAEHEGETRVALTIDEQGKVASCEVSKSSGFPGLDEASCPFVRSKWSFTPALDFDGKPTKGRTENSVSWYPVKLIDDDSWKNLPRKPNANVFKDPGRITLQFELDANGLPINCEVRTEGLEAMLKQLGVNTSEICNVFSQPGMVTFDPFIDTTGNAQSRIISVEINLKHPLVPN